MDGQKTEGRKRERRSQSEHAPCFPFFYRDWLSDPAVQALSFDLRGRYHHWLCMTQSSKTPGRTTEEELRRTMQLTPAQWRRHRDAIAACFELRRDGAWVQKRTVRERTAQKRRHRAARESGKKGSRKRWQDKEKDRVAIAGAIPAGMGSPMATGYPSPSPTPSPGDVNHRPSPKTELSTRPATTDLLCATDRRAPDVSRLVGDLVGRLSGDADA